MTALNLFRMIALALLLAGVQQVEPSQLSNCPDADCMNLPNWVAMQVTGTLLVADSDSSLPCLLANDAA